MPSPPPIGTDPWERVADWTEVAFEMAGGIYPLEGVPLEGDRADAEHADGTIEARPGGDRREVFERIREAAG